MIGALALSLLSFVARACEAQAEMRQDSLGHDADLERISDFLADQGLDAQLEALDLIDEASACSHGIH